MTGGTASLGPRIAAWAARRGAELRLSARVTVAGLLSFVVVHLLNLPQGYWAVFAGVIVTQASVGGSLQMIFDWLVGTLGGAIYGTLVATAIPHTSVPALGFTLAVALAPLALMAALNSRFRVAPVTAIIVLLSGTSLQAGPLELSIFRVLEISVGSAVGLIVSIFVLPARAHGLVGTAGGRVLDLLARLVPAVIEGVIAHPDADAIAALHDNVRLAIARLETVTAEALRERISHLTREPDPEPLLRTLRRVRNDLIILTRASAEPLPAAVIPHLAPHLRRVSTGVGDLLRATGAALAARRAPPSFDPFDQALDAYAEAMAGLRGTGLTRELSGDAAGRIFALGFALEQLRQNFKDLHNRVVEFARK